MAKALQLKLIGHFGYMKCNPRTQMNRNGATTAIFKLWSIASDIGRKPPKNGQFSALRILIFLLISWATDCNLKNAMVPPFIFTYVTD